MSSVPSGLRSDAISGAFCSSRARRWSLVPSFDLTAAAARARGGEQTFAQPWSFDRIVDAYCAYDATGRAGRINCPTLVTSAGEQDLITGPRFAYEAQRAIPNSKLHIFERTSHNFWVEKFDEWGVVPRDFFGTHGDD